MKKYNILIWFIVGIIPVFHSCREDLRDIKLDIDDSPGLNLNFSFVHKPDPGMELIVNLYYVEEEDEPFYEKEPDKVLKHTLNTQDIENGLTLTFEEPIPSDFAYVLSYVDMDTNGELSDGDIAICYLSQSVREVLKGITKAENVSHRAFLTMIMDQIYSSLRPPLEVNLIFPSPPLPGSELEFSLYYAESEDNPLNSDEPGIVRKHILTEKDITNGLLLTFEGVEDLPYLYAMAYVDIDRDGNLSYGDIAMFHGEVSINDVREGKVSPENIGARASITMVMSVWHVDENAPLVDIDGNTYNTVVIGDLEWMTENLKVTRYRNGASIPTGLPTANWTTTAEGAYVVYPYTQTNGVVSSEEEMIALHGLLYNGYAVVDPQGLAPAGWRIATDEDYKALERMAGMPEVEIDVTGGTRGRNQNVGTKLRAASWIDSPAGTDEFGFAAIPGGYRQGEGEANFRVFGSWDGNNLWTSTVGGSSMYMYRRSIRLRPVERSLAGIRAGMHVRCVRDR